MLCRSFVHRKSVADSGELLAPAVSLSEHEHRDRASCATALSHDPDTTQSDRHVMCTSVRAHSLSLLRPEKPILILTYGARLQRLVRRRTRARFWTVRPSARRLPLPRGHLSDGLTLLYSSCPRHSFARLQGHALEFTRARGRQSATPSEHLIHVQRASHPSSLSDCGGRRSLSKPFRLTLWVSNRR